MKKTHKQKRQGEEIHKNQYPLNEHNYNSTGEQKQQQQQQKRNMKKTKKM